MTRTIIVGMADLNTARGDEVLTTLGLGSCVGIALYDPITKIGGLAHIMLPESMAFSSDARLNRAKFADTAIVDMLGKMAQMGAGRKNLVAKIAGGAHMFTRSTHEDIIKVGQRNTLKVREILAAQGIPIRAEDVGGTYGRTIELRTADGSLWIRTIGRGEKII